MMDWRADIKDEMRHKIVENIAARLKEQWPACDIDAVMLNKITVLATNFENEVFRKATTKDQYAKNICKKMRRVENCVPPAKPGAIQESCSIQNTTPALSSDVNDKCAVQVKREEVLVSQPLSPMANRQYQQPPVAPYQLLQKNTQQLNVGIQQQNRFISQETINQHLLQSTSASKPHEQLHRKKPTATVLQKNQQFGIPNQSSVHPQNTLNSSYRSPGFQSHVSGIQMSRDMLTPHSNVLNLQPIENLTGQLKEELVDEGFVVTSSLQQQQHPVIEQQHRQHQPHVMHTTFSTVEEWADQAYLELQCLKETHFPALRKAYEKTVKQCTLAGQSEMIQKLKSNMYAMERMMGFMEMPWNRLKNFPKEKFYHLKQSLMLYVESHENRSSNRSNKQALHGHPDIGRSHISLIQGSDNVNSHFQPPLKLGPSDAPNSSPKTPRQNKIASPHSSSESSVERGNMLTMLQKRQHAICLAQSQNINQEYHSSYGRAWKQRLNSEYSRQMQQLTSSNFPNEAPQISHTSSQIDQLVFPKDPLSYGRAPSPCTPLTPPSTTVELVKTPPYISFLSSSEDIQYPQTCNTGIVPNTRTEIRIQSHEIISSGTITTLLAEPTNLGSNQQSTTDTQPIERLLKAVESMSGEALRAAVSEINAFGKMNDTMIEVKHFEMSCYQHETHLSLQDGCDFSNNLKRDITATAFNDMSSPCSEIDVFERSVCQIDNQDSTATSKKLKTLHDSTLLDDMRNINRQLVETVLEFESAENVDRQFANAGTVLRCSYSAIAVSKNLKFQLADSQKLPVMSVNLLVPVDYPNSYPVFISRMISDSSPADEESSDLSSKAKSMLHARLRSASRRLSLAELARAWDECARAVVFECAQRVGGESFSSQFGTWEDCVATT